MRVGPNPAFGAYDIVCLYLRSVILERIDQPFQETWNMPCGKKRKRHKMATHKRKKRLRKNRHKKKR